MFSFLRFLKICFFLCLLSYHAFAQQRDAYPVEAVQFHPEKTISLIPSSNYVMGSVIDLLLTQSSNTNSRFIVTPPKTPSDYTLSVDYATGCGAYNPTTKCRMMFLWTLWRADGAPVGGWRADYPVIVPEEDALNRFSKFIPDKTLLYQAVDDIMAILLKQANNISTTGYNNHHTKPLYISPETGNIKSLKCDYKTTEAVFKKAQIKTQNTPQGATYRLDTQIMAENIGGGLVGLRFMRTLTHLQSKQSFVIPQEIALPADYLRSKGLDCQNALTVIIPQIKDFIARNP